MEGGSKHEENARQTKAEKKTTPVLMRTPLKRSVHGHISHRYGGSDRGHTLYLITPAHHHPILRPLRLETKERNHGRKRD
jgi:hypothetical protein